MLQTTKPTKVTKGVGAVLIALSGFILYLDKVFKMLDLELLNVHGYNNTAAYIWSLTQTLSPILIIAGFFFWINEKELRFYLLAALIPLFCYFLQFYFVQDSNMKADDPITWIYIVGSSVLLIFIIYWVKKKLLFLDEALNIKMDVLERIVESQKNNNHQESRDK